MRRKQWRWSAAQLPRIFISVFVLANEKQQVFLSGDSCNMGGAYLFVRCNDVLQICFGQVWYTNRIMQENVALLNCNVV